MARMKDLAIALDDLAREFGDGMAAAMVGPNLTCSEVEALVGVLTAGGFEEEAARFLEGHAAGDKEPDDWHHELYLAMSDAQHTVQV